MPKCLRFVRTRRYVGTPTTVWINPLGVLLVEETQKP